MSIKFFNIGSSVFNVENIVSVSESTEKVEIEKPVAIIKYKDGNSITVALPDGKTLEDCITAKRLNIE